jgi:hypothetical protein
LEEKTYQRLQDGSYTSFDGIYTMLSSIVSESSFTNSLQYNLGIFPAYFMFTMAVVTLSAYKFENAMADFGSIQVQYWMLPWLNTALQFLLTINSPLRTALLFNNLAGLAIGRSYKAFTDIQPVRQKLNRVLGMHID